MTPEQIAAEYSPEQIKIALKLLEDFEMSDDCHLSCRTSQYNEPHVTENDRPNNL